MCSNQISTAQELEYLSLLSDLSTVVLEGNSFSPSLKSLQKILPQCFSVSKDITSWPISDDQPDLSIDLGLPSRPVTRAQSARPPSARPQTTRPKTGRRLSTAEQIINPSLSSSEFIAPSKILGVAEISSANDDDHRRPTPPTSGERRKHARVQSPAREFSRPVTAVQRYTTSPQHTEEYNEDNYSATSEDLMGVDVRSRLSVLRGIKTGGGGMARESSPLAPAAVIEI